MVASAASDQRSPLGAVRQFKLMGARVAALVDVSRRPAVLLIHGNSSSKEIFTHQIGVLRRLGFGILAPDLPGHGDSEDARRPTQTYNMPGYARVLRDLFDQLKLLEIHIVGWSLGGHIGLELLATERRVRSLMIIGAPPVTPGPALLEKAFLPSPMMVLPGKRALSPRDVRVYGECLVGGKRYLTAGVLKALRRTDGAARHWMVRSALTGVGTDEVHTVRTKTCPLAVVHGRHDVFISSRYLESLPYRALWRERVHMLDSGHAPHWQRPRLFNKLLAAFLEEVA